MREFDRIATGELVRDNVTGGIPQPNFWSALGDYFRGEDAKWDDGRIILKAEETWTFDSGSDVPDFLDGDTIEFFKKL